MVMVNVPFGPLDCAVTVIVEVAPPVLAVTGLGANVMAVLAGFPDALSVTELPAPIPVSVMVAAPEPPRGTFSDAGVTVMVKSGEGVMTLTATWVECGPDVVPVPVI